MRSLRLALAVATLALLAAAPPAEARRGGGSAVALGLGADYLIEPELGEFQLTLALESAIARAVTVGVRFGALVVPETEDVGAPIDFRLRIRTSGVYLDGLIGPWLLFDERDVLRFHGAFGFGLLTRSLSFGLEVGVLGDDAMAGLRLAFPL